MLRLAMAEEMAGSAVPRRAIPGGVFCNYNRLHDHGGRQLAAVVPCVTCTSVVRGRLRRIHGRRHQDLPRSRRHATRRERGPASNPP